MLASCLILFLTAVCHDDRLAGNCGHVAARHWDALAVPAVCSLMLETAKAALHLW